MTTNDGGPAFPVHPNTNPSGESAGMALRDWFAGQFLMGAAAAPPETLSVGPDGLDAALSRYWGDSAKTAYIAADAMLKARGA